MPNFNLYYVSYLIALIASAIISGYAVRKILFITRSHKIYDVPDDIRKIHGANIPSLGGIGIFTGYMMVALFYWDSTFVLPSNVIVPSTLLLFFAGIYDDLMNMRPYKKLVAQLLASVLVIFFAGIRIYSLNGLCGIGELPFLLSLGLTTIACTLFINAFNFVDGIDGLACSLTLLYTGLLAALFMYMGHFTLTIVALSIAGATAGLLYFNWSPAKIYMGDTGSMMLGFTIFILCIVYMNGGDMRWEEGAESNAGDMSLMFKGSAGMMIVLSILFLPLYDAIRVFIIRLSRRKSPLMADRTHMHYYLLDAGYSHPRAVGVIVGLNILVIATAFAMRDINPTLVLLCMILIASTAMGVIYMLRKKRIATMLPAA